MDDPHGDALCSLCREREIDPDQAMECQTNRGSNSISLLLVGLVMLIGVATLFAAFMPIAHCPDCDTYDVLVTQRQPVVLVRIEK